MVASGAGWLAAIVMIGPAYATALAAASAAHQPIALDYAEPFVYAHARRLVEGASLYQPITTPPYTVAAYFPLYYVVAAATQALFGGGFGPGRIVSFIAGIVATLGIGVIVSRRTCHIWPGAVAGLMFLGLAFPGGTPWLGLYRVDLLGLALSIAAIGVLLQSRAPTGAAIAGVLAGLAILTKQAFFAAPLAGALWHWPDRRRLVLFVVGTLATVAIPCGMLELTTHALIENTLLSNVNPLDASIGYALIREMLEQEWLPLALACGYLVARQPWRSCPERLLVLYWLVSAIGLVGLFKVGANHNYWLEFAAATTMLAALGLAALLYKAPRVLSRVGAIGLPLGLALLFGRGGMEMLAGGYGGVRSEAYTVQQDLTAIARPSDDVDLALLIDRIRLEPGDVLADPADVVVLANRHIELEPLIYTVLLDESKWSPSALVRRICAGSVSLVVLGAPLETADSTQFGAFGTWPPPVVQALRQTMTLQAFQAQRYVYSRRAGGAGSCAESV
jgi:hypothetical protein